MSGELNEPFLFSKATNLLQSFNQFLLCVFPLQIPYALMGPIVFIRIGHFYKKSY